MLESFSPWRIEKKKLQQINFTLTFCLTLLENHHSQRNEINVFVVCLERIRFGGKVFGTINQVIGLNKPFVFLVLHLRLHYPIYDTNLLKNKLQSSQLVQKRLGIYQYRLSRGEYCGLNGWSCRIHSVQNCHRGVQYNCWKSLERLAFRWAFPKVIRWFLQQASEDGMLVAV